MLIDKIIQVYIAAITDLVPDDMVRTFSAFMEFCYLARRSVLSTQSLGQLEDALAAFHRYRQIFVTEGVRPDGFSSLPRQHALDHYPDHIRKFGTDDRLGN